MALNLILDANLRQLSEPGFWRFVSTRELVESGNPVDDTAANAIWSDEPTRTLMLRPLQLDPSWLNTPAQVDSIIGINQMAVNSADVSAGAIFQAACFGNNDNPWIFHVPVGPSGAFPARTEPVPGSSPSIIGVATPITEGPSLLVQSPTLVYNPSLTLAEPSTPPAVTPIGSTADGKFLCRSQAVMAANQPLYFRWFHPESQLGFPVIYRFYVGQYRLHIKDVTVEVYQDVSPAGDRTSWKKVAVAPLWSAGDTSPVGSGLVTARMRPQESLAHDRSLLWLPFRQNQVLLYSSAGKWAIIPVNGRAQRLTDGSDWYIVRPDSVVVWVQTPAAGRFQVQKVKFPASTASVVCQPITLDYTPSSLATVALTTDADHATQITFARSSPPSYTIPANSADDCPKPTTISAADQRRTYGVQVNLTASADQRWTPFFYGLQLTANRVFADLPNAPHTITDTNPGSAIVHARLTAGLEPGEGRLTAEVIDESPYPLANYYYRSSLPIQLMDTDSGKPIFTGLTTPTEVTPIRSTTGSPRRLTFAALDRWKALADTYLRDQRDWSGYGHIDVVNFMAQQAGIDTTGAEYPAGYTPASPPSLANLSALNSPLNAPAPNPLAQQTRDVEPGWRPRQTDTAASFVKRVKDLYSGWYCGFRLDGTFFYLPRTYFTTPSVTFTDQSGGANPIFKDPVTFTTIEPEANVIVVMAGLQKNGSVAASSTWIDWQSILNPAAVNYLGRWRAEVVQVGGTFSCSQLNWIARVIWNQTRRRYRHASFEAQFVPTLKIGQQFTLGSYGNYRLIGMDAQIDHEGYHLCRYTGELVENGY